MGNRLVIILALTAAISFVTGKFAAVKTMTSIEASMTNILNSIEAVEDIHKINQGLQPKTMVPQKLVTDPQL
jgi:ethanolamine transporter EutH